MVKKPYEFINSSLEKKLERELEDRKGKIHKYYKTCLRCGQLKMLFEFSREKRNTDGRLGVCKVCKSRESLKYYYLNKETISARVKKYRETHKTNRSKYFENYREKNKKHLQVVAKRWYKKNKKAIKKRSLEYYNNNREYCQFIRELWRIKNRGKLKKYNREYQKLKSKGGDEMLRKSKKGFTLIELMVVAVIIGVLAVLGLRVYFGQIDKAKNAVIKANVGTIQTLIQGELADRSVDDLDTTAELSAFIFEPSGIHNPVTSDAQIACPSNAEVATAGEVWVEYSDNVFTINGRNANNDGDVFTNPLRAIK